jgi:large subunit ribosomal protein L17
MRHRKKTVKLGRKSEHRNALLANLASSLILHSRVKTTLTKAKAVRPLAEKLVTLGKKGAIHHRRLAASKLMGNATVVTKLFADVAPRFKERQGGYTRILRLGNRNSDASSMALIEWVDHAVEAAPVEEKSTAKTEASGSATSAPAAKAKKAPKKADKAKE